MPRLEAFLFDLDGTLTDSEVIYVDAVRDTLAERGHQLSTDEAMSLVYGRGAKDIYLDAASRFPGCYRDFDEMEEEIRRHFLKLKADRDISIPGSVELLKNLAKRHPVAIVSGSPRKDIHAATEQLRISLYLSFILGAEDYFPGKPDPACYKLAAERIGREPSNCLVFEDSSAGVISAKRAGAFCVGLQRKGAPLQDLSQADAIYTDLADFRLRQFEQGLACP